MDEVALRVHVNSPFNPLIRRTKCTQTNICDCAWSNFQYWLAEYSCSIVERSFLCTVLADLLVLRVPGVSTQCASSFTPEAVAAACSWTDSYAPIAQVRTCSNAWLACRPFAEDSPSSCSLQSTSAAVPGCIRQNPGCNVSYAQTACADSSCVASFGTCAARHVPQCAYPPISALLCSVYNACPQACSTVAGNNPVADAIRTAARPTVAHTPAQLDSIGQPFYTFCRWDVTTATPGDGVVSVEWNDCGWPYWRVRLCYENDPRMCYGRDGPVPHMTTRRHAGAAELSHDPRGDFPGSDAYAVGGLEGSVWVEWGDAATPAKALDGVLRSATLVSAMASEAIAAPTSSSPSSSSGLWGVEVTARDGAPNPSAKADRENAARQGTGTTTSSLPKFGRTARTTFIGLPAGRYFAVVSPIDAQGKALLAGTTGRPVSAKGGTVGTGRFHTGHYQSNQTSMWMGIGLSISLLFGIISGVICMLCTRWICMCRWRRKRDKVMREWEEAHGARICEASLMTSRTQGSDVYPSVAPSFM